MKSVLIALNGFVITLALSACTAPLNPMAPVSADRLLGTWKVDLRSLPTDAPYLQEFVVTNISGKSFNGTFYGTPVEQARINIDWGTVRVAFVTSDGSGAYHHSAVLKDGHLEGLSNSTGRGFLSYWSASKP
jgi:hypothetical protein